MRPSSGVADPGEAGSAKVRAVKLSAGRVSRFEAQEGRLLWSEVESGGKSAKLSRPLPGGLSGAVPAVPEETHGNESLVAHPERGF